MSDGGARDGNGDGRPPDDADLASRRADLERQLAGRRSLDREALGPTRGRGDYSQGFRLATEFVPGVLVGAALGWGFDTLFGTSPWGLIVFLLLGFAAGVLNMLRTAGLVSEPGAEQRRRK